MYTTGGFELSVIISHIIYISGGGHRIGGQQMHPTLLTSTTQTGNHGRRGAPALKGIN